MNTVSPIVPIIEIEGFCFLNAPNRYRRMWPGVIPRDQRADTHRIWAEASERICESMAIDYPDAGHPVGLLMNVWDWEEYLVWSRELLRGDWTKERFFCLIVPERRIIRIG